MKPTTVILAIAVSLALAFCPASTTGEQVATGMAGLTTSTSLMMWPWEGRKPNNYCWHNAMCRGDRRVGGSKRACCFHQCIDVESDRNNCGACKHRCHDNEACCGGWCVHLSYNKRHCGACNRPCKHGQHCVYGMCDYA